MTRKGASLPVVSYDDFKQHATMLRDTARTLAFQRGIEDVVKPGMVVLDFGCGTGILSFFAERAGADRIYAVDRASILRSAEALAKKNGFRRITFLRTDGDTFKLPEKVDVIVSEWMGFFVLYENMLPTLLRVRDQNLRREGVMIPSAVRWKGAFVVDRAFYDELAFFDTQPYGIDFSLVRDWAFSQVGHRTMSPFQLGRAFDLQSLDMKTVTTAPELVQGRARFEEDLTAYAFCGWFEADLSPATKLDTGPDAPATHWRQLVFPWPRPFPIRAGEDVTVQVRSVRFEGRAPHWHWSVAAGGERLDWDDFSYRAHFLPRS